MSAPVVLTARGRAVVDLLLQLAAAGAIAAGFLLLIVLGGAR